MIEAAFVVVFLIFIGLVGASATPQLVWFGGFPLPRKRFYGAALLHPDYTVPIEGEWEAHIDFGLLRGGIYRGHFRRVGAWMLFRPGPRRIGAPDLVIGHA